MRRSAAGEEHGYRNAQATVSCADRHNFLFNGL
jgi:hypothetical protein